MELDYGRIKEAAEGYKKEMRAVVKAAMDDGVHYGNIVTVPAYCVGDIGHHIGQASYNMCKDVLPFLSFITIPVTPSSSAATSRCGYSSP